jgi:hypothetical protein
MVYIYYITYRDYMIMCVLAMGDDEVAMGDDNDASSEVAGEGHAWECLESSRG